MPTLIQRYPKLAALGLLLFWNFILVSYRVHLTETRVFVFFLWNLFLAIVPYLSTEVAGYFSAKNKRLPAFAFVLLAILFLPNAPYIITDLFHLRQRAEMPLWFDTMAIFSVALSGLVLFYVALFGIKDVLERFWGGITAEASIVFLVFLCSFGIYLGRYLRFNSWDVLSNTNDLFDEIGNHLINSSMYTRAVGVTLLYGTFLLMGYWVIRLFQMGNTRIFEASSATTNE